MEHFDWLAISFVHESEFDVLSNRICMAEVYWVKFRFLSVKFVTAQAQRRHTSGGTERKIKATDYFGVICIIIAIVRHTLYYVMVCALRMYVAIYMRYGVTILNIIL